MQNDIPPKQTVSGTPLSPPPGPADAGYDHLPPGAPPPGALVSVRDLAGDAGAFPVLKAFQDYLETERQQARKRLVTLTAFFVALMALVIGGFVVAFVLLFGRMTRQQEADKLADKRMQETLLQAALEARKPPPTPAGPSAAELAARQFETVALDLQTNLGTQLASVGATATKLDTKVEAQNEAMAKLRDSLAKMATDNAQLQSQVTNMQQTLPKLALEAARAIVPAAPPVPIFTPSPGPAYTPPAAATPPIAFATPTAGVATVLGYDAATLTLRGRDGAEAVPWRVLLPSRPDAP